MQGAIVVLNAAEKLADDKGLLSQAGNDRWCDAEDGVSVIAKLTSSFHKT